MDTRREFIKKTILLSGATGFSSILPSSIQRALAINPEVGSTYLDAEHVVILMQENRSFDHCFGSLQGVRGFNDPRAIKLPNGNPVWLQSDASGSTYAPFRLNIKETKATWMGALPHSRHSQVDAYNGGKYDNWLQAKRLNNKEYAHMPLTLGYYDREDLPFNYAMADAFTICDHNFSSAMTSTTPNRSFFWTGKITNTENGIPKANIRNEDFRAGKHTWKTFPELLEENDIPWRFYQNDITCGGGFSNDERSWLANFGCNNLEAFEAYHVKFGDRNVRSLKKQVEILPNEIKSLLEKSKSVTGEAAKKLQTAIKKKQTALDTAQIELTRWSKENFDKLTEEEKRLHRQAFTINSGDPDYRTLSSLKYENQGKKEEVIVPKGDLLYQFRKDVNEGKLPTVSWLASPKNFSDHPSAPWYGAWYVSEVLDILTKNPEIWKKTIFILTYDENDGYFDHLRPFSIPDNGKPETGKCSAAIDTEIEYVRLKNELEHGVSEKQAREAPVGLGFRVPMIIASPWSKGGKVCSQVFDHTSTLQFLEGFVNKKFNKNIKLDNISQWRRTICGDLTSVFTPFNKKEEGLPFLQRDAYVERIHNARFKKNPSGFKSLTNLEIKQILKDPMKSAHQPKQEKGIRPSCALPYELYADGKLNSDKKSFEISLQAGDEIFGKKSKGSPFTVSTPVLYSDSLIKSGEYGRIWSFAVSSGDTLTYQWQLENFDKQHYHLCLDGPNGFFREFKGDRSDPELQISCKYQNGKVKSNLTGNVVLNITNLKNNRYEIEIIDHVHKGDNHKQIINNTKTEIPLDLKQSYAWYDFSVRIIGFENYERRYSGRVETGVNGFTDPIMGGII